MEFSVIYSVDCPRSTKIGGYLPEGCYRKAKSNPWTMTEGDEQYDYGYLEGEWEHGKHRKFCAVLSEQQWRDFVDAQCIRLECRNTMGMIGAPGCGVFASPAVAFGSDDQDALQSVYAFPLGTRADCARFLSQMGYEVPQVFTDADGQTFLFGEPHDYAGNSFDVMVDAFIEFTEDGYPDPSELEQAA